MRKTKIICTQGPAVDSDEMARKLILAGMDCARFNFSHGTHAEHKVRIDRIKRLRKELGVCTATMLDTKGPEIRVRNFKDGATVLTEGQEFTLDTDDSLGDNTRIGLTYHHLAEHVKPGTVILMDDGKLGLEVLSADAAKASVLCKVTTGGKLSNHKSINLPGNPIPMPYISKADKSDILFGIEQEVDFIAASFVRSAQDVHDVRKLLKENGGESIQLISKIENSQGVDNLDEIIEASDGIMVARGDLGVEIPFREIPALQKLMIEKCIYSGKIVVTATQMLESMTHSPRPTRAEVSDVANAVYDGTTAIMLSGESAAGKFPAEAVRTMAEIAEYTESSIDYRTEFVRDSYTLGKNMVDTACVAACDAAKYIDAKAIVSVTRSGRTAAFLSDFKPNCPIIALCSTDRGVHQLNLRWGVSPIPSKHHDSYEALYNAAVSAALESGIVQKGDTVVVVTGSRVGEGSVSDTIRIATL